MRPVDLIAVVLAGYLLGAIPSGLIIGRLLSGVDIRTYGSGRTGATNAMRSLGARGFALTFVADALKAAVAVLLAQWLVGDTYGALVAASAAGFAAIVGHNWSIYIRFGGGRGVSSAFGAMLALYWPGAIAGLLVAALLIPTTRYVSLGSIVGTVAGLIATIFAVWIAAAPDALTVFAIATALLVVIQHRDNLQRLLSGTERRIGDPRQPSGSA